ncbi:MAG: substrate-binding domain-containing protein [Proteobacteria bacterium]|nr:substrate-binding domain-containing protein [Pseudomonadota bacterium]
MRARWALLGCLFTVTLQGAGMAGAAEIKVLTAGAFKQIVLAVAPLFERTSGHKLVVVNDTVGALVRRIKGGEEFDVAVVTPAAAEGLAKDGKLAPDSVRVLARVGVGVMVRAGAPVPDISTVEAFKQALIAAKSVAYIDPASGGSSGIYVAGLLDRLGVAEVVKAKAKLKKGGYVADLIVGGEADLGIHQISEIVPVKEVVLVGPLPADIQNYTVYAGAVGAAARDGAAARALIEVLRGGAAAAVLKAKGMEPAGS